MTSTVVITGANRGIGLALARLYKARGWHVIATARNLEKDPEFKALDQVEKVRLDVADEESLEAFREVLKERPVDILINNIGIMIRDTFENATRTSFLDSFTTNTIAPLSISRLLLPNLLQSNATPAKIVNMTSRMGSIGDNNSGSRYSYRASKAALNAVSKCMAVDLQPRGISVAILHPGFVKTDMTGGRGDVTPEESAQSMVEHVIDKMTLANTGKFWHKDGFELPW